jgi:hypothetical protein
VSLDRVKRRIRDRLGLMVLPLRHC